MSLVTVLKRIMSFFRSQGSKLEQLLQSGIPGHLSSYTIPQGGTLGVTNHNYLFHLTDTEAAEAIIRQKRIYGAFGCATLAQSVTQCFKQAEKQGCLLIFEWKGKQQVGSDGTNAVIEDLAYHHVGTNGYVETYVKHGSNQPLILVAIGLKTDDPPYKIVHVFTTPVDIFAR